MGKNKNTLTNIHTIKIKSTYWRHFTACAHSETITHALLDWIRNLLAKHQIRHDRKSMNDETTMRNKKKICCVESAIYRLHDEVDVRNGRWKHRWNKATTFDKYNHNNIVATAITRTRQNKKKVKHKKIQTIESHAQILSLELLFTVNRIGRQHRRHVKHHLSLENVVTTKNETKRYRKIINFSLDIRRLQRKVRVRPSMLGVIHPNRHDN